MELDARCLVQQRRLGGNACAEGGDHGAAVQERPLPRSLLPSSATQPGQPAAAHLWGTVPQKKQPLRTSSSPTPRLAQRAPPSGGSRVPPSGGSCSFLRLWATGAGLCWELRGTAARPSIPRPHCRSQGTALPVDCCARRCARWRLLLQVKAHLQSAFGHVLRGTLTSRCNNGVLQQRLPCPNSPYSFQRSRSCPSFTSAPLDPKKPPEDAQLARRT